MEEKLQIENNSIDYDDDIDDKEIGRVELHCHTKMSMYSVVEISDLIKYAIKLNHKVLAITDYCSVQGFPKAFQILQEIREDYKKKGKILDFKLLYGVEINLVDDTGCTDDEMFLDRLKNKELPVYRAIIIALNEEGKVNMYHLISDSFSKYLYRYKAYIPKSDFLRRREGLIIGSVCGSGEVYQAVLKDCPEEKLTQIVSFYDYLEIQPSKNLMYLIEKSDNWDYYPEQKIEEINKEIVSLGDKFDKPVVASCNVHFLYPEEKISRRILFEERCIQPDHDYNMPLFFRRTQDMISEFSYLDYKKAEEIVITNPKRIAGMCDDIEPVSKVKYFPEIRKSVQKLYKICYRTACSMYGNKLPKAVNDRLEEELKFIVENGYSDIYIILRELAGKARANGYLVVPSPGCFAASSFAAYMAGITEVNHLKPHYLCPKCGYSDFELEGVKGFTGGIEYDLPDKVCPVCSEKLNKQGNDIPIDTFFSDSMTMEQKIGLEFSGNIEQTKNHLNSICRTNQRFNGSIVPKLHFKTAYCIAKKYYERCSLDIDQHDEEIRKNAERCIGAREERVGNIGWKSFRAPEIICPEKVDINTITPLQWSKNDKVMLTHFDDCSISHNLLSVGIYGNRALRMLHMMQDLTGISLEEIPMDNPRVMSLFRETTALNIKPGDIGGFPSGILGISFIRETEENVQRLLDVYPKCFADLVRIKQCADEYSGMPEKSRANAVIEVINAYRIAYYKVFYPLAFYAAFFSDGFPYYDYQEICARIEEMKNMRERFWRDRYPYMDLKQVVACEMYVRGYEFTSIDATKADESHFRIIDGKLMPPLKFQRNCIDE